MLAFRSAAAIAAPFCVVSASGKQCYYYDAPSCNRAAAMVNGACVVNDEEVRVPAGGAPFCVISGTGSQCFYYDYSSCQRAAKIARGTCVARTDRE